MLFLLQLLQMTDEQILRLVAEEDAGMDYVCCDAEHLLVLSVFATTRVHVFDEHCVFAGAVAML